MKEIVGYWVEQQFWSEKRKTIVLSLSEDLKLITNSLGDMLFNWEFPKGVEWSMEQGSN